MSNTFNLFFLFLKKMKKINQYCSLMNKIKPNNNKKSKLNNNDLSTKLNKTNIYNYKKKNPKHLYLEIKNTSKQKILSNSRYNTESKNQTSKLKNNEEEVLINSYEKSIISLFGTLKNIVEKSQYENLKSKFQEYFENNLKTNNEKKSSSFINNSNSIKKIIDETIKECKNINNSNNILLNITPSIKINKLTHKSLYSLSLYGRRIITQSPNKFNQNSNNSIVKKYNKVSNKNSKSTQNGSSYLSGNKNSNSRQNLSKELSFPIWNNTFQKNKHNNIITNIINEDNCNLIEEINNVNKTVDDSIANNDLLNKIKNNLDDNLKGIFAFSYQDFLNKSSDRLDKNNN